MSADAAAFLERDRRIQIQKLIPQRVALTVDQVRLYDLPTSPAKATDSRTAAWSGGTCQLEALAPDLLARIVRAEIEEWFDATKFENQLVREEADRAELFLGLPRGSS
jgi:hypothetical protein